MKNNKIFLSEDKDVSLVSYIIEQYPENYQTSKVWQPQKRPAVLILPGGAYQYISVREGEPVALKFLEAGFNAFVLSYSVKEKSAYPRPLEEASKAIWYIRQHAEEFGIDPDKIAVAGFSAGGHLATLLGTQWNNPELNNQLGIPEGCNKPNALVVGYPVTNISSFKPTVAKVPVGAMFGHPVPEADTVNYVSANTPPTFIWHTQEDGIVPCGQSIDFASQLNKKGIPFELHLFNHGAHGESTSDSLSNHYTVKPVNVKYWIPMAIGWLKDLFDFT